MTKKTIKEQVQARIDANRVADSYVRYDEQVMVMCDVLDQELLEMRKRRGVMRTEIQLLKKRLQDIDGKVD